MRNLPIDSSRLNLIASGKVMAKAEYAELSDGSRKRLPDAQAKDRETGLPLWVVDCFLDDDDVEGRAEVVAVTVASATRPVARKFQAIVFTDLVVGAWVRDGRANFSFRATGIANDASAAKAA